MKGFGIFFAVILALTAGSGAFAQETQQGRQQTDQQSSSGKHSKKDKKKGKGTVADVRGGAGSAAGGVAKGAELAPALRSAGATLFAACATWLLQPAARMPTMYAIMTSRSRVTIVQY